jgi:hypothetical protein
MGGGGDVEVNRRLRGVRRWRAPPPLRPSCGGTERFRLSHPLPNVPNVPNVPHVLNVLKIQSLPHVPTNARRAAPRPYSKGSDRAGGHPFTVIGDGGLGAGGSTFKRRPTEMSLWHAAQGGGGASHTVGARSPEVMKLEPERSMKREYHGSSRGGVRRRERRRERWRGWVTTPRSRRLVQCVARDLALKKRESFNYSRRMGVARLFAQSI